MAGREVRIVWEEEDAVIECSDGRRFSVVKATLSACSGFFR